MLLRKIFQRDFSVHEFFFHRFILHNRSCDQLRKQGYIGRKCKDVFLCCNLPAININRIGHCLKGIKRNSNRKCYMQQRQPCPCNGIDTPDNKIRVLKNPRMARFPHRSTISAAFAFPGQFLFLKCSINRPFA